MVSLLVTMVLSWDDSGGLPPAATEVAEASATTPLSLAEVRDQTTSLLRREATVEEDERAEVIRGMVEFYARIRTDSRLAESFILNQYQSKLLKRLMDVKVDLERQIAREQKKRDRAARVELRSSGKSEPSARSASDDPGESEADVPASARGGGAADSARQLVDLIERTIAPDFWRAQGGPGSVFYYRRAHALIISATPDIHRDVAELLEQLRSAD